ncbi:ABC transporter ATP-binding protein [Anaerococcus sp. Marseille-Q5996]|uniref:ABC transporter ATP-binding protein n=1 Tax=Anaerococcus sp. Marseille-Q5996 TaxID=2972769 RepID=UPI0021C84316|nr:sn-glycerol-3-phosphate ABC transporter ATP-binding protein UgpC [Anaerococcus sp. Marseille-Q5996]
MEKIVLENISKKYDNADRFSVKDFNIKIKENEFIVFVGPSGCGKSTTLRMIAGLEDITEGNLYINGKRMNDVAPKDRGIAMVFQNYSLYPHLNVYENIGFGLKIRKVPKDQMDNKIRQAAKILDLTSQLEKKPSELSGGQRQRVALGRAIVKESDIMLMDEPLSNLDAKLRVSMRKEIVELQQKLGSTVIYVTHDQTEAMTMATRIVCMNNGVIQQIGTPKELYENPTNLFVAGFLGSPNMNFIEGRIEGGQFFNKHNHLIAKGLKIPNQDHVTCGIRPENMEIMPIGYGMEFDVKFVELLGSDYHVHGNMDGDSMTLRIPAKDIDDISTGVIYIDAKNEYLQFFGKDGNRIYGDDILNKEVSSIVKNKSNISSSKSDKIVVESR